MSDDNSDKNDEISTPIDNNKVSWLNAIFGKTPEYKRKKQNSG